MASFNLPPVFKLRPVVEFGDNLNGFVEHVEQYRKYMQLKEEMEHIRRDLLTKQSARQSFKPFCPPNSAAKPKIGFDCIPYVPVKNENPTNIVIDVPLVKEDKHEPNISIQDNHNNIPCTKCNQTFKSLNDIRAHMQACHDIACYCLECEKSFPSQKDLKQHTWEDNCGWKFNCDNCSQGFKCENTLNIHLTSCEAIKREQHICGFKGCIFPSQTLKQMRNHKFEAHKGINVKCDMCDFASLERQNLVRHRKRNHTNMVLKCRGNNGTGGCGKEFKRTDTLNEHIKACGLPLLKPWDKLSVTQKRRRARAELAGRKTDLDLSQNYIAY